jgi:hypothetical protein
MGPCAQYLMTGQWPTAATAEAFQGVQGAAVPQVKEQRLAFLKTRLDMLQQQIAAVREQIAGLGDAQ